MSPNATQSEDCLHINIFRPSRASRGRLPVFFWIHGGGFIAGSGGDSISSDHAGGTNLALSQNSIVVTINYRLGPLGFMVKDETSSTPGGFNGIRDIIEAFLTLTLNPQPEVS